MWICCQFCHAIERFCRIFSTNGVTLECCSENCQNTPYRDPTPHRDLPGPARYRGPAAIHRYRHQKNVKNEIIDDRWHIRCPQPNLHHVHHLVKHTLDSHLLAMPVPPCLKVGPQPVSVPPGVKGLSHPPVPPRSTGILHQRRHALLDR